MQKRESTTRRHAKEKGTFSSRGSERNGDRAETLHSIRSGRYRATETRAALKSGIGQVIYYVFYFRTIIL